MKNVLPKLTNTVFKKASMLLLAASALSSVSLQADVVYVTTYVGPTLTGCPPVCHVSGLYSTFGGSGSATVSGAPARDRYTYGYSSDFSWSIRPTLGTAGGVYQIHIAHPTFSSTSPNVLVTATTGDGTLSSGAINSPVFNSGYSSTAWHFLGTITLSPGVNEPTITFAVTGGDCGPTSSANRLNIDAFRFTEINPCLGVAGDVTIGGPLAAGQTFVNVLGVDAAASAVTVYEGGSQIGQITSGIVAGSNMVPTSAINFSSQITATQTKSGCTSDMPVSGPKVGGGPNPGIKAFLSVWKSANFAGPIGAHTTSNLVSTYTLKADGLISGSQSAPTGGQGLSPSQCWETVTFDHATDSARNPNDGASVSNFDPFCALDGLVFAIDAFAPDSGPYDIYIDRIMNGNVVIEDFESYTAGGLGLFKAPNAATQPNPVAAYLSAPNSSEISTVNAFDGTKALRIRWQWANNSEVRWSRVIANATAGKHYPQLDTTKPITIRYLVLPVGETEDKLSFTTVPATQTKGIGDNVTFSVTPTGDAPYSYQWQYEGLDIVDATSSSYSKSNLAVEDSGTYTVIVYSASCYAIHTAGLSVSEVIEPPTLNYSVGGGQVTFTWTGSFTLQSKSALDGSAWNDITPTSGYAEPLNSSTTKFFRLRQ
ncbi:MAG: immunoglobulin domain-containing protein [Verrucomicrobia bacterium]|nr:immunoglobulin domain-containing protein [Verrucomicrobiota bacterium]